MIYLVNNVGSLKIPVRQLSNSAGNAKGRYPLNYCAYQHGTNIVNFTFVFQSLFGYSLESIGSFGGEFPITRAPFPAT